MEKKKAGMKKKKKLTLQSEKRAFFSALHFDRVSVIMRKIYSYHFAQ